MLLLTRLSCMFQLTLTMVPNPIYVGDWNDQAYQASLTVPLSCSLNSGAPANLAIRLNASR